MEETAEATALHEQADKKLKAHCEALCKDCKAGEQRTSMTETFLVTGRVTESTKYDVPEKLKKKYAAKFTYVRKSIKRVGEADA
jgi:hypothetical protein